MNYKIILTNTAYRDLEIIKAYIAQDSLVTAKQYVGKIINKFENLSIFPKLGKKINNSIFDYAKCFYLPVLNHIAIYQINEIAKCIYIVRVLSHFQDWKNIINKDILLLNKVIIQNDRISIELLNTTMYYDVWINSLDDNNRKYAPDEVFESLEEASAVVDQIIKNYSGVDGPFVYAVLRNSDKANLGYVQLIKVEDDWEIGYHIAKRYCGSGYATEALGLFIDYLKQSNKIKKVYGIALFANKASRRVLEKNGFELIYEGVGLYQGKKRKIIKTIKEL